METLFTLEDEKRLIEQVGIAPLEATARRGPALHERLDGVLHQFLLLHRYRAPTPSKALKSFKAISSAAGALRSILEADDLGLVVHVRSALARALDRQAEQIGGFPGLPPEPVPEQIRSEDQPEIDWRGAEKLKEWLGLLELIEAAAKGGERSAAKRIGDKRGHRGDFANLTFIEMLVWAWCDLWGTAPTASLDRSGNPASPFMRFVAFMQQHLLAILPKEELRRLPVLRAALRATPASMKNRVQRAKMTQVARLIRLTQR